MWQSGVAPVHIAARRGNLAAVKALVSHDPSNAELPDNTEYKATALHHAAEENRTEVVKFLTSRCPSEFLDLPKWSWSELI